MAKSERQKKLKKKEELVTKKEQIEYLRAEYKQNKEVHKKNINLLKLREDLLKANEMDLADEKERYEHNKETNRIQEEMAKIEAEKPMVINPVMEFHESLDWKRYMNELKKNEVQGYDLQRRTLEKDWNLYQKEYKERIDQTNSKVDEEKILKQQGNMDKRNKEIISQLKELGFDLVAEEVKEASYIG